MNVNTLEHVNLTVRDLDRTVQFILAALPTWRVRGEGRMDWYGKPIRWLHIGTDTHYLALQGSGEGEGPDWQGHQVGAKHVGVVVDAVDAVVARLAAAGFALDHWGGDHPFRRRAYVMAPGCIQFEFVEYLSEQAAERNDYGH